MESDLSPPAGFSPARGTARIGLWWALLALAVGAALVWAHPAGDGRPLAVMEAATVDWRFHLRGPLPAAPGVAIVALDDRSLERLGRFPVPRAAIADLLAALRRNGVTIVGLDLLLLERQGDGPVDGAGIGGDEALRAALRTFDHAVLAAAAVFGRPAAPASAASPRASPPDTAPARDPAALQALRAAGLATVLGKRRALARLPHAAEARLPVEPFRAIAAIGHANIGIGESGTLRRAPAVVAVDGAYLPGLPVVLAGLALNLRREEIVLEAGQALRLGPRRVPTGIDGSLEINHYGPRGTIPTHSLVDVLDGRVPRAALDGHVVLVGSTALGAGDLFATPFSRDVPGVEVLATLYANLLRGEALIRDLSARGIEVVAIVVLSALAFFAANLRLLPMALAALAVLLAGWAVAAQVAFGARGLVLGVVEPMAAVAVVGLSVLLARLQAQRALGRRLAAERANLAQYQSPLLAETLARGAGPGIDEGAQEAAVLFVDLVDFTSRSDRLGPARSVDFLREFHLLVEREATRHGGLIEQFMGDGAMLVFGLPRPAGAPDAAAALACARGLLARAAAWSETLAGRGEPPARLRIGVHCGKVHVARLGGIRQRQVAITGDVVNVASRLEALGKTLQARLTVSQAVVDGARTAGGAALLEGLRPVPAQPIRGRDAPLDLWILPL